MPVTTKHEQYESHFDRWKTMRDLLEGEDAIKAEKSRYLPQPAGRSDDDFAKYIQRAQFFDATAKTADGMVGGIFRKPPVIDIPKVIEYIEDDANGRSTPLAQFAKDVAQEVVGLGRAGVLVDMPDVPEVKRLDEEKLLGADARLYLYRAESIINWSYARVGSSFQLSRVILHEIIDVQVPDDEFAVEPTEAYRVLDLESDDATVDTGVGYRVRLFQEKDGEFEMTSEYRPTLPNGDRLAFIPFVFIGSGDNTADVDKPPLMDIANVNVGHYRNSADYEDAIFMVGQPTPVITGLDQQFIEKHKGQFVIGSRTAWMLPANTSASMLESSRDLMALANAMERKEGQMVQLGARLIDSNPAGVEAAETIRLRQSGEASTLASIADNISRGVRQALNWASEWMGGSGEDCDFACNTDFFPARLNSADLKELVASWQGGVITYGTLFENLVAGEVITAGTDLEEYESELETEALKNPAPMLGDEDIDEEPEDEDDEDDEEVEEEEK